MRVTPGSLADEIAEHMRRYIEEQQLQPGMKLPAERQLAAQLGVSRNSLHEALARLVSEGLLLSRRGGGTFVRSKHPPWSEQNIIQPLKTLRPDNPDYSFDILEARHAIEAGTAWYAAIRATPTDKERIRRCFDATLSDDPDLAARADVRFHLAIVGHRTTCRCCKPCADSSACCTPRYGKAASVSILSRRFLQN